MLADTPSPVAPAEPGPGPTTGKSEVVGVPEQSVATADKLPAPLQGEEAELAPESEDASAGDGSDVQEANHLMEEDFDVSRRSANGGDPPKASGE